MINIPLIFYSLCVSRLFTTAFSCGIPSKKCENKSEAKIGEKYDEGYFICSPNSRYQFGIETEDGDLCLCDTKLDEKIWCADTDGGDYYKLQNDGNVVMYKENKHGRRALWSTSTANFEESKLVVEDDGVASLIHESKTIWSTGISSETSESPPSYTPPSSSNNNNNSNPKATFTFYIVGDTPYNKDDYPKLTSRVQSLPKDAEALIHVGDIRSATGNNCDQSVYDSVRKELYKSHAPVFIVPGDNDINDCPSFNRAWDYWSNTFLSKSNLPELKWNNYKLGRVKRQSDTANFALIHQNTLLLGVDVPGGSPHDRKVWEKRYKSWVDWLMDEIDDYTESNKSHNSNTVIIFGHGKPQNNNKQFFQSLNSRMKGNSRIDMDRVLYVHGDGHSPKTHKAFGFKCVQVDMGRHKWLRLRVTSSSKNDPFDYDHGVFRN